MKTKVYLTSDAALYAKTKHYFRLWHKQRTQSEGCCHPNQRLTSRVCWLQGLLLRRFQGGTKLPRDVWQYIIGYKIPAIVFHGKSY